MQRFNFLLFAMALTAVSGCGGERDSLTEGAETKEPAGVIPQSSANALENAKGVEQLLQSAEDQHSEELDRQSR